MASSNTKPRYIPTPFASQGQKNTIPVADQGNYLASWSLGFPPVTSEPLSEGGLPPTRLDVNGAFNVLSAFVYYLQVGGLFTFDPDLSSYIGGYPNGMMLWYNDGTNIYPLVSTKDNNTDNFISNPSYIGTSWARPFPSLGLNNVWTGTNTFSGTVSLGSSATATTPSASDNSTKVATTAWINLSGVKSKIVGWGMPDYSSGVSVGTSGYTATSNGIVAVTFTGGKGGVTLGIYINGSQITAARADYNNLLVFTFPVAKNDTISYTKSQDGWYTSVMFYPCLGG